MIIRVICGQKNSYQGDLGACDKRSSSASSMFNVQISGLQLKIIRATLNYIKNNRGSSVSSVVKKNNYQGGRHARDKRNL